MQADEFAILSHKMNEHAVACSLMCRKTLQPLKLTDKAKLKIAVKNMIKLCRVQGLRMPDLEKIPHVGDGAIDILRFMSNQKRLCSWHLNWECHTIHVI